MLLALAVVTALVPPILIFGWVPDGSAPTRRWTVGLGAALMLAVGWWLARGVADSQIAALQAAFRQTGPIEWRALDQAAQAAARDDAHTFMAQVKLTHALPGVAAIFGGVGCLALAVRRRYRDAMLRRYQGSGSTTSPEVSK